MMGGKCMDMERERMLREVMSLDFTLVDLNLYLDTHPTDQKAINYYNTIVQRSNALRQRFEQTYGPLLAYTFTSKSPWQWIDSPWPWEKQ